MNYDEYATQNKDDCDKDPPYDHQSAITQIGQN